MYAWISKFGVLSVFYLIISVIVSLMEKLYWP